MRRCFEEIEKTKEKEDGDRQHRLVTEYDSRSSPALGGILEDNHNQMVAMDQRLGKIFPKPPRAAFKQGKNIQDLLCRARRMNTTDTPEKARN